ncbi:MAG: hypothetical protein V4615_00980 [Bacteroidota bacterium]
MELRRIFKGEDTQMTQVMLKMMALFEEHLPDFTTYDTGLDAAFLTAWKNAWQTAMSTMPDKVEVAEGEELLDESLTALEKCRAKYKDVKYFATKAFPANKKALKEFGEGQFSKVSKSPLRMVQFMETLFGVATKYKTELIAKNYSQSAIDEIVTLTDALREDNKMQQLKKKERPTETRKRIESLNSLYSFGQQVAQVAPLVFPQSPAKQKHFRLTEKRHPKVVKGWITLAPSAARKINLTNLLKKFNVTLTNQSKENIEYWRAENIHEEPFHKFQLAAGEIIELNPEVPIRKFLVLKNTSPKEVRIVMAKKGKE